MRRVVVTGIGLVSPLGCGNSHVWSRLIRGDSGIGMLPEAAIVENAKVRVAATVPKGDGEHDFNEKLAFGRSISKECSTFMQYAMHASDIAMNDAGNPITNKQIDSSRAGVAISSGVGSIDDIVDTHTSLQQSYRKVSPYFIPKILINMAAGNVSIRHKLQGPCHSTVTACAASAHSIGDASNFIRLGYADLMLAGGAEACVTQLAVAGFARMNALSPNPNPAEACRPFDEKRDGFVMGEGASVLVLEDHDGAVARGANIYAELVGYGTAADSHHITSPPPDGGGAVRAMRMALQQAGLSPDSIGYINAHATSTPVGDKIELGAINEVFRGTTPRVNPLYVSSTKGATGHLLGASGAIEAAFCVYSLVSGQIPPTLNLSEASMPDNAQTPAHTDNIYQHVPVVAKDYSSSPINNSSGSDAATSAPTLGEQGLEYVMSNSFGFGGTNVSLIFKRYKDASTSRKVA